MTMERIDWIVSDILRNGVTTGSFIYSNLKDMSVMKDSDYKALKIAAFKKGLSVEREGAYNLRVTVLNNVLQGEKTVKKISDSIQSETEDEMEQGEDIPGFEDYHAPSMLKQIESIINSDRAVNIWFSGPSGCGKTTAARYLSAKLGRKLFKINGEGGTTSSHFFGANTVVIDSETGKNKIVFVDGIAVQAMKEGLDKDGNVCGKPGILFIDEAASLPPSVGICLNAMMETRNKVREISIPEDNGRIVRSHPGFTIILAGNTNGLGASSASQQQYSAQRRALDASMIQRITATFRFGYDKTAEYRKILSAMPDYGLNTKFLNFKDCLRKAMKDGEIMTPFSTTKVIDICDSYSIFAKEGKPDISAIAHAVCFCYMESVLPDESSVVDELFRVCFGEKATSFVKTEENNYDYI